MSVERTAGLGWGQRYLWLRRERQSGARRTESTLVLNCELDDPLPLPRLRALVDHVVRRHEGLRTTFHHDTGGDPGQRVHPPAPLPFAVATAERDGTPTPAEVIGAAHSAAFDLAAEWPVRACAVTRGGVAVRLVLVFDHLVVDRWTIDQVDHDLAVLYGAVREGRRARMEPVSHQPLDLARHEATPAALAAAGASLDWWRAELAALPADTWAARRAPADGPVAHEATLTSHELADAVRAAAARHGVWPSVVMMTAYAAATAAYTGSDTVVVTGFASNRDLVAFPRVHTCLFSPQLLRVDCSGDPDFPELLRRVDRAFTASRPHTYVPYDVVVEDTAREGARRGQQLRIGHELNIIGESWRETRVRRTTVVAKKTPVAWAETGADSFLRLHDWRDALAVTLSVRAELMDARAVEEYLRVYERSVLDPAARLSALASELSTRPRRLASVAGDAVDLDLVADILRAHPAVDAATVSVVGGDLVADIRARAGADLRGHVLAHHVLAHLDLPGAVRCPRLPDAGTCPPRAASAAEGALARAVAEVNGLPEVDIREDYVGAGGRVLRGHRVLGALAARGWRGLSQQELASPVPLRALAARLAPHPPPVPAPVTAPITLKEATV